MPTSIPATKAFILYDTFGLIATWSKMRVATLGIRFDAPGFDAAMDEQRKRAQRFLEGRLEGPGQSAYQSLPRTDFEGYHKTLSTGS